MLEYIDVHGHLFDHQTTPVISPNVGVLAVTMTPDQYHAVHADGYSMPNVRIGLGLHPTRVDSSIVANLARFRDMWAGADFIGEVGLCHQSDPLYSEQVKALGKILHCCRGIGLVNIHNQSSTDDIVNLLREHDVKHAIMHWYKAFKRSHEWLMSQPQYYFSFNLVQLRHTNGVDSLKSVPIDRVLLETDGPYTKTKVGTKLDELVRKIASIKALEFENVRKIVLSNTLRCLKQASIYWPDNGQE